MWRSWEAECLADRRNSGVNANGVFNLPSKLQELDVVFQAIEHFRVHFKCLQSPQRFGQLLAGGIEIAACRVSFSQAPQADRFAPLVFRVPTYLERPREPCLRFRQIARAKCKLSQITLAVAFQLLMLDTSSDDQTLFEELLGTSEIGLSYRNFTEVKKPDRLSDPIFEVTKNGNGVLFIIARPRQVILLQVKRSERG